MTDERFTFVEIDKTASEHLTSPRYSYWKSVFKKFFSNKAAMIFLVITVAVILMSLIYPLFSDYSTEIHPYINDFSRRFISPNSTYWFGTDNIGDSLFDQIWLGTRNSLTIAIIATTITTVLGVIVGAFWGYSKKMDVIMIEVYNVVANVPFTLVVIILMYVLGQGYWQLIFALSVTSWLGTAYFIRIQVMMIRDREYNLASRCLGTPMKRIITHNIMPFLVSVIVTSISRDVPNFISYEVFLSYLGIGLTETDCSLGRLITKFAPYMKSTPYLFWIPVAMSAIISVSLYIVGQTLADASDPKTHM